IESAGQGASLAQKQGFNRRGLTDLSQKVRPDHESADHVAKQNAIFLPAKIERAHRTRIKTIGTHEVARRWCLEELMKIVSEWCGTGHVLRIGCNHPSLIIGEPEQITVADFPELYPGIFNGGFVAGGHECFETRKVRQQRVLAL